MREEPDDQDAGRDRILAFSDGIFAIAITLLILNVIPPPHVRHDLLSALAREWPKYVSYVLSFVIIGIVWSNHHRMFQHIKRSDHTFLLINVLFLMWVASIPFPTALLAEYLGTSQVNTAMAIYAGSFIVGSLLFQLVWQYATYHDRLLGGRIDRRAIVSTNRSFAVGWLVYLIDFAVSLVNGSVGLILFIIFALFYAIAPYFDRSSRPQSGE